MNRISTVFEAFRLDPLRPQDASLEEELNHIYQAGLSQLPQKQNDFRVRLNRHMIILCLIDDDGQPGDYIVTWSIHAC